ncbi:hypothetical protein [Sphingomonas sp. PWP1-2]|uniref:hypothetical protein n=1 Tax=Sphingomonas sp. PWP1-2 TaxID=2804558 RepID=UPI003CF1F20C
MTRRTGFGLVSSVAIAALLLGGGSHALAAASSLSFDRVFTAAGEPAAVHYQLLYRSHDGVHRMEVWRVGDHQVKRVTDKAVISLATHRTGEAGYRLTIFDLKRRIATQIDRANLYRVGNFTDWFDLTHGLRHPNGPYTLAAGPAPAGMPRSVAPCAWYRLAEGPRTSSICWDARRRVPLLIAVGDKEPIWRLLEIDTKPAPAGTFTVDTRGFTINDANHDIERD